VDNLEFRELVGISVATNTNLSFNLAKN